jgi:hypothetical protein
MNHAIHGSRCGCLTGHLPCTFFCACRGESSNENLYNKDKEGAEDGGNINIDRFPGILTFHRLMDNDLCLSEWIWLHIVLDVIMDDGSTLIIVVVVVVGTFIFIFH